MGSLIGALMLAGAQAGGMSAPMLADACVSPADFHPPVTHVYHLKGGGTLVFVAVLHGDNVPTRLLLQDAFARYKPVEALVEGFSSTRSVDPAYRQRMRRYAERRTAEGALDEVVTTISLATAAGARVSGWDMTTAEDYAASTRNGFAIEDVIGAHLIRRKIDPFAPQDGAMLDAELREAGTVGPVGRFDYADWYRRHYGDHFVQANGTPCGRGIGAEIVRFETAARNRRIMAVLQDHLAPAKTVLIEAGANHWLALRPWLRSLSDSVNQIGPP